MKMKKVTSIVLFCMMVLASMFVIMPATANALDVADCTVARIGVDPRFENPIPVQLIDNSGLNWTGPRQFYLSSTLGNQGLATLLTGYSMSKTFWVRIAGDGSSGSLIEIIFIND
jgi:hypothetical protein